MSSKAFMKLAHYDSEDKWAHLFRELLQCIPVHFKLSCSRAVLKLEKLANSLKAEKTYYLRNLQNVWETYTISIALKEENLFPLFYILVL